MGYKCKFVWVLVASAITLFSAVAWSADSSPYGINSHVPNNQVLDLIAQAGIKWIRVDFNWFQLEPAKDSYNWGFMDSVVNNARARGLEIFATLAYTPSWASGTSNVADPPRDINDWYDFVYDTVNRYKSKIKYWGMWNEPNLKDFFTGNGWQYREWILKTGAQAAKAADPSCLVLGPELAHLKGWSDFMEEALKEGGANYIDIITHHCYKGDTGEDIFDYLDEDAFYWPWDDPPLMKMLDNLGIDNKPVWLTEVGWHTSGKAFFSDGTQTETKDSVSENDQALYYHQLLWGVYKRSYLYKVFPYEIIDDPNPDVPKWGIVKSNYTPKKAYYTYKDFIAKPTEPDDDGGGCGKAATSAEKMDFSLLLTAFVAFGCLRFRRIKM